MRAIIATNLVNFKEPLSQNVFEDVIEPTGLLPRRISAITDVYRS